MGKSKKIKVSARQKNVALDEQLAEDKLAKPTGRNKVRHQRRGEEEDPFVDEKLSKQILTQARLQAAELHAEVAGGSGGGGGGGRQRKAVKLSAAAGRDSESDDDDDEDDEDSLGSARDVPDYESLSADMGVDPRDERAFQLFMSEDSAAAATKRRTIADIIHEKITEKKTEIDTQFSDCGSESLRELDPRVKEMYEGVGAILAKYRSGKVPKAFKVIAQFRNWEQLLLLTAPDKWSAAAVYQATRIFTSNLKEKMAQRFFNLLLLPRVRDDIDTYHRLNFHLYQALHKALFKPGAFFKGFLLPLCEAGDCTLREAIIVGSVLARHSIPVLHTSAAMLRIAEMDYSGANSIFLRVFFDKKYALPYRVVDAAVFHFLGFRSDKRELPVLWHQALLTFVQRYKQDVSSEQKESLLELLKAHAHPKIAAEVRRELQHSKCRDEEMDEPMSEPMAL